MEGALKLIERNYDHLRSQLHPAASSVGFLELDDIFHETILLVSTDALAAEMTDDAEFMRYFQYRMRMVVFQTTQDRKIELQKHADYQKVKKQKAEDW